MSERLSVVGVATSLRFSASLTPHMPGLAGEPLAPARRLHARWGHHSSAEFLRQRNLSASIQITDLRSGMAATFDRTP
jgi:hypothetical protein